MIVSIDLKALSEETIAQMGYEPNDLWKVKIGTVTFGPFETESLRHYVSDNEHLFENAEACLHNETEWKPFWAITKFTRRKTQLVSEEHPGPFWLLVNGLVKGPYSNEDIKQKIKANELVMTDHISITEGQTWNKVYEIRCFDRRAQRSTELPSSPELKKVVIAEPKKNNNSDMLAEMAFIGQQQGKSKTEEINVEQSQNPEHHEPTNWGMPIAATFVLALAAGGFFFFGKTDEEVVADAQEKNVDSTTKVPKKAVPKSVIPDGQGRIPASTSYAREAPRSILVEPQTTRIPTHYESHDQFRDERETQDPKDQPQEPQVELEPQEPVPNAQKEHSLVENNAPAEEQSLDAAMNGQDIQQPQEPQVREVQETGDF